MEGGTEAVRVLFIQLTFRWYSTAEFEPALQVITITFTVTILHFKASISVATHLDGLNLCDTNKTHAHEI